MRNVVSHSLSFPASSNRPFQRWRDYEAQDPEAIPSALCSTLAWKDRDEARVLGASMYAFDLLYWVEKRLPRDGDRDSTWQEWRSQVNCYLSLIREAGSSAVPKSAVAKKLKVELLALVEEADSFARTHESRHRGIGAA